MRGSTKFVSETRRRSFTYRKNRLKQSRKLECLTMVKVACGDHCGDFMDKISQFFALVQVGMPGVRS